MSIAEKLTTVAENTHKVYAAGQDAGWQTGYAEGHRNGYAEGETAEYDSFWNAFQMNGSRRNYMRAFSNHSGGVWNSASFKPKYNIICEGDASMAFYAWEKMENVNIGAILKNRSIALDTTNATNMTNFMAYGYCIIGELPAISFESAGAYTTGALRSVAVTKIEKLIVTEQTDFSNMFTFCSNLEEIRFEGTVANGKLDLSYSKSLSAQSLESVVSALSTEASGLSVKLPNTAKATYDTANGSGAWETLLATRQNWSFEYA